MKGQVGGDGGLAGIVIGLGVAAISLVIMVYLGLTMSNVLNETALSDLVDEMVTSFSGAMPIFGVVLIMTLLATIIGILLSVTRQ